ncbi:MAG: hydrogenase maturation protease [Actinomycetota bacterium]
MKILVAGVGSVLWGDDGFGVAVAHRLQRMDLPPEVTVVETGTGGIHLVQEISAGYDALIVVDASDQGRPPGTVMVIDPEVEDVYKMDDATKYDFLADMHYTKPERALMLAKALKVLPRRFVLIGGQPEDAERYGIGLSQIVATAVDLAVPEVIRIIHQMLEEDRSGATSQAAKLDRDEASIPPVVDAAIGALDPSEVNASGATPLEEAADAARLRGASRS